MTKKQLSIRSDIQQINITDPHTMEKATHTLSRANKHLDKIITEKRKLLDPLNETRNEIIARYKPIEEQLTTVIKSIKENMKQYQIFLDKKEAKITQKVLSGKLSLEKAMTQMPISAETSTSSGKVKFREVPKFRITDITKVPKKYLTVDQTLVKDAQKQNVPIAGIEYYTEKEVINYR